MLVFWAGKKSTFTAQGNVKCWWKSMEHRYPTGGDALVTGEGKEMDEEGEMSTVDEMGRTLTGSSASCFNGELIDRKVVGTRSTEKTGGDAVKE